MTMKLFPFAVTEDDYWVSLPLDGLTPEVIFLGVLKETGYRLFPEGIQGIMETVERRGGTRCTFCNKRTVRRIFLIFAPIDKARMRGFAVCETCADQMKQDVALP